MQFLYMIYLHFVVQETLQPVINWYLLYCMAQDKINICIYLICQIWRRMFQQFLCDSS
jgi:hypothetical protein